MDTVRVRLSANTVRQHLQAVPGMLSGRIPMPEPELARGMMLRVATSIMSILKPAFVAKARGGSDEAGDSWKPLAESTIEARLRKGKTGSRRGNIQALKRAYAGFSVTGRGQKKIERLTNRTKKSFQAAATVEILRDTGHMFNSLSPGYRGELLPDGQLDVRVGMAEFGTNVEYAMYHHHGTKRIPQRRLWPEVDRWPSHWWRQIGHAAETGIRAFIAAHLRRAA